MYGIWCAMYMIMNNVYMIDMWYEECICMIYSIDIDNSFSVYIMYAIYENDDILYTNEINDSCNLYGLYSLWNTYDLWLLICMLYMVYIIYNRYFCLICMMYTQKNILCSIYNLILQHTYIYMIFTYMHYGLVWYSVLLLMANEILPPAPKLDVWGRNYCFHWCRILDLSHQYWEKFYTRILWERFESLIEWPENRRHSIWQSCCH